MRRVKPGTLLRLEQAYEWHNCYEVDAHDNPTSSAEILKGEVAVYLGEVPAPNARELQAAGCEKNTYTRYKCLLRGRVVLISASCLRPVQDAE